MLASNQSSDEIGHIGQIKAPNLLPPEPFLSLGIYSRLAYERLKAKSET